MSDFFFQILKNHKHNHTYTALRGHATVLIVRTHKSRPNFRNAIIHLDVAIMTADNTIVGRLQSLKVRSCRFSRFRTRSGGIVRASPAVHHVPNHPLCIGTYVQLLYARVHYSIFYVHVEALPKHFSYILIYSHRRVDWLCGDSA